MKANRWAKFVALPILAIMGAVLAAGSASATPAGLPDQQVSGFGASAAVAQFQSLGQVFTAGVTGTLTGVVLDLSPAGTPGPTGNLVVSIESVTGSGLSATPSGTVLGQATLSPDEVINGSNEINFSPGIQSISGTQYAIVLADATDPEDQQYLWFGDPTASYPGGSAFGNRGSWFNEGAGFAFVFQTFVSPPSVPTTTTASATLAGTSGSTEVSLTATVAADGISVDQGTVSFYNGPILLCTSPVDLDGSAACTSAITPSPTAPHTLRAVYSDEGGAINFLTSTGYTDTVPQLAQPTLVTIDAVSQNTAWVVTGGGFSGATSVTVCGQPVAFTVVNDNVLLVAVPAINGPQQCTMSVIAAGGTGSSANTVTVGTNPVPGSPIVVIPTGPAAPTCATITLSGQWTLIAWPGATGTPVASALSGAAGGCATDVAGQIAVVWGFDATTQTFEAYFPSATGIPGANDLTTLTQGLGYWIALSNPAGGAVTWMAAAG